jgi:hypothetical protein
MTDPPLTTAEAEVEFLLAGLQFLPSRLQQGRQLAVCVVAEPRCSTTLSRRPCLTAICTAVAPDAVRTLRMYAATCQILPTR